MAVNDTWIRTRSVLAITGGDTDVALVNIPLNDTLLRIHGGIAIIITLPAHTDHAVIEGSHWVLGLYTTLTVGGSIQNPSSNPGDAAPPLQRWLWWEQLYPVSMASGEQPRPDTRQKWLLVPTQNPLDIKAQVKATTAVTLHLGIHTSSVPAQAKALDVWYWFSVLRSGT